jgi:hypothetical protein
MEGLNSVYQLDDESAFPVPSDGIGKRTTRVYPYPDMRVGQSFEVPEAKGAAAMQSAKQYRDQHKADGWDFVAKRTESGFRFWRTA